MHRSSKKYTKLFVCLFVLLYIFIGFIHVDNPDAPICQDFLIGSCKLGKRCLKHHCSLPYHWQYKVPNVNVWNSFGDKDNTTLERLYCDVNSARMAFKPVKTLNFSSAERYFVDIMVEFYWDHSFSFV